MKTYWESATDMSRTDLRELENRLAVLVEHLLKIGYVTGQVHTENLQGWNQTVRSQRRDRARHIQQNKALKSKLTQSLFEKIYRIAAGAVMQEYRFTAFPPSVRSLWKKSSGLTSWPH